MTLNDDISIHSSITSIIGVQNVNIGHSPLHLASVIKMSTFQFMLCMPDTKHAYIGTLSMLYGGSYTIVHVILNYQTKSGNEIKCKACKAFFSLF